MGSVSELVAESPNLGFLARFVEPGSPVPSHNNAQELWKYLAVRLLPAMAESRGDRSHPLLREFRRVQTLAIAAKISDFSLQDFQHPQDERWSRHMTQIAAFYEFTKVFRAKLGSEIAELDEPARKLELYSGSVEQTRRRLQDLEESGQSSPKERRAELKRQVSELRAERDLRTRKLNEAQREISEALQTEISRLQTQISQLDSRHSEHLRHKELLQPVLARGATGLKPEVARLRDDVDRLQRESAEKAEMEKRYARTMLVLSDLKQELRSLIDLKNAVLHTQHQRKHLETTNTARQRKDSAVRELNSQALIVQRLSAKVSELSQELESKRKVLAELSQAGADDPEYDSKDANIEEELLRAQKRERELEAAQNTLVLNVKAQRKWLQDMERLEVAGQKLTSELEVVRKWMELTLHEAR